MSNIMTNFRAVDMPNAQKPKSAPKSQLSVEAKPVAPKPAPTKTKAKPSPVSVEKAVEVVFEDTSENISE